MHWLRHWITARRRRGCGCFAISVDLGLAKVAFKLVALTLAHPLTLARIGVTGIVYESVASLCRCRL